MLLNKNITKFLKFYYSLPYLSNTISFSQLKPIILISEPGAGKSASVEAFVDELNQLLKEAFNINETEKFDFKKIMVPALSTISISGIPESIDQSSLVKNFFNVLSTYLNKNTKTYNEIFSNLSQQEISKTLNFLTTFNLNEKLFKTNFYESNRIVEFANDDVAKTFEPLINKIKFHLESNKIDNIDHLTDSFFNNREIFNENLDYGFYNTIMFLVEASIRYVYKNKYDHIIQSFWKKSSDITLNSKSIKFFPIEILQSASVKKSVVFLDELNRVQSPHILNMLLNIMLDKKIPTTGLNLQKDTIIIGAMNYTKESKATGEMVNLSKAMLDRVIKVALISSSKNPYTSTPEDQYVFEFRFSDSFLTSPSADTLVGYDLLSLINKVIFDDEDIFNANLNQFEVSLFIAESLLVNLSYPYSFGNITDPKAVLFNIIYNSNPPKDLRENQEHLNQLISIIEKAQNDLKGLYFEDIYDLYFKEIDNKFYITARPSDVISDNDTLEFIIDKKNNNLLFNNNKIFKNNKFDLFSTNIIQNQNIKNYLQFCNVVFFIYNSLNPTLLQYLIRKINDPINKKEFPAITQKLNFVATSRDNPPVSEQIRDILRELRDSYTYKRDSSEAGKDTPILSDRTLTFLINYFAALGDLNNSLSQGKNSKAYKFLSSFTKEEIKQFMLIIIGGSTSYYHNRILLDNLLPTLHNFKQEDINQIKAEFTSSMPSSSTRLEQFTIGELDKYQSIINALDNLNKENINEIPKIDLSILDDFNKPIQKFITQ